MAASDDTKREMYITLLHLVHQKRSTFKELMILLNREPGVHIPQNVLGGIHRKIEQLKNEWNEDIPNINVLVFTGDDVDNEKVTSWVVNDVFDGVEPTQEQIDEFKQFVEAYDKWDEVLEAFKYWK